MNLLYFGTDYRFSDESWFLFFFGKECLMKGFKKWGWLLFIFLFTALPLNVQAADRVQPVQDTVVIVIDPGHGGENEGTIENGFQEKSMTMVTAQAMYEELCQYDNVEVYMTHTEDVDMTLKERAEFAASVNADFLFSIHYNASVDHDLFGSEVWISAEIPFHAYGYQFGYQQMLTMRDMGLFLRGVKTKLNDRGTDYYGVIREAAALSVPAVIIEHCHVDEERDYPFCDTQEEQIAFGKADAVSVAKYFGLKSASLGVDYSGENSLPQVQKEQLVQSALADKTEPDVCLIEVADADYESGALTLKITAADYDSPLIYYDYSLDGGVTYSPLQMWPGSNVLDGSYTDIFSLPLQIPSGTQPDLIVRAYNEFDLFTESNRISTLQVFRYGEEPPDDAVLTDGSVMETAQNLPGTDTFRPAVSDKINSDNGQISFLGFLRLCLILVVGLFLILLISRAITLLVRSNRRKKRCGRSNASDRFRKGPSSYQDKKEAGDRRNHPR